MIRAFQWDLARQVERLDWLLAQLPRYAEWGYQELYLHLEDAVEYPSVPRVARRDAYTHRQLGRLVAAAARAGIKVVPIVNLLGHTQYLVKVPELRDLNELRAPDGSPLERGQICPLHPRTLEIAESLLRDVAPFCTAGKVHVGLDESFHLGRHPLSRKEIARIGLAAHFARYVQRLRGLTRSLGLEMGMWADMLYFLPDAIPLLPSDLTAYEWYYHAFRRRPRVELFNFAEVDLATPLRRRGIQLYGCPMNGAFRYEPLPHFGDRLANAAAWWRHAQRVGAAGFLMTGWEPNRLALELTTVIDAAAACLWLDPGVTDPREMLARGFVRAFSKVGRVILNAPLKAQATVPTRRIRDNPPYHQWADLALACDRFPFAGYPRWQINERWDTVSRREPLAGYRAEERYFARLAEQARRADVPVPLRASVEFRHYLAVRDRCVHELRRLRRKAAGGTPALPAAARALQANIPARRRAAQAMWRQTRSAGTEGPNAKMIERDLERLRALRRGERVFGGEWQLCYRVWNFAPAVQVVGIEQQLPDGSWRTLQSCHTIEFQTAAAQSHGTFVREHAAPVDWDGARERMPVLRLFVRGVGEVKVGAIALTNGSAVLPVRGLRGRWRRLGRPAPRRGWPVVDWTHNAAALRLPFSP